MHGPRDGCCGADDGRTLSQLLVEQVEEVMARYASSGLYLVNRREQEGWVALELGRSEPCEGNE